MKIDCISDLHGHYPTLEGGDLLIISGDLTRSDHILEYEHFDKWLRDQQYRKKIIIAGNHDNCLQNGYSIKYGDYLFDSGIEFEELKVWGSPWTKRFEGMNPRCMAFTVETDEELAKKWELIPDDIDILVTHSPPCGILDELIEEGHYGGSVALEKVVQRIKPKIHVFGHIHEAYGSETRGSWPSYAEWGREDGVFGMVHTKFINSSHVNEHYEPVNKPIRIEL